MTTSPVSAAVTPQVSVIVPSYNSARTICACLDSLLAQSTALPYEIVVADSSDDDTPALLDAYARRHADRVVVVRSGTRLPPGPARNLALRQARGAILAFTDADCVAAPDWITRLARHHAKHDAIGGRILNGTPASLCGTALYIVEFAEFGGGPPRQVASVPSCNLSFKRAVMDRYGPFPAVAWGEEYILNSRVPGGIRFVPDVIVRHLNRTGFRETLRHARTVGRGGALSRRATGQVAVLFRWRALIALLWPYRFVMAAARSLRSGSTGTFVLASPIVLLQLAAWTTGFWQGAGDSDAGPPPRY